jgi:hypothetical protein
MDFNIRDTCISIMECSEIQRRTIPVEEEEEDLNIDDFKSKRAS